MSINGLSCFFRNERLVYAYDYLTYTIVKLTDFSTEIVTSIPKIFHNIEFTNIVVKDGVLCLYSRRESKIIVFNEETGNLAVCNLKKIDIDRKGFYFSNIILNEDKIVLLPFCENRIYVFNINGEVVCDQRFEILERCLSNCKGNFQGIKIRAWGAYIIQSKLYCIISHENKDYFTIFDLNTGYLNQVMLGNYEKLFCLTYTESKFCLQAIVQDDLHLILLDLNGQILQDAIIHGEARLHMQWWNGRKLNIFAEDRLILVDKLLEDQWDISEYLFKERYSYISSGFVKDSNNEIYMISNGQPNKFSNYIENLLKIDDYKNLLEKYANNNILYESSNGINLKNFIKIIRGTK